MTNATKKRFIFPKGNYWPGPNPLTEPEFDEANIDDILKDIELQNEGFLHED